jgi:hypothetical protein
MKKHPAKGCFFVHGVYFVMIMKPQNAPAVMKESETCCSNHFPRIVIWSLVAIVAVCIAVICFILLRQPECLYGPSVLPKKPSAAPVVGHAVSSSLPVVMYGEEVGSAYVDDRRWATIGIFRAVGGSRPEKLAEVGKIGEYPAHFVLSPDKQSLFIDMGSRITSIDLTTWEMKDVYRATEEIGTFVISPDGTQLFIWDQKYVDKGRYSVHILTLATGEDDVVKTGTLDEFYLPLTWRDDGIVLMERPAGEAAFSYYFDLATNELKETPGMNTIADSSRSGKVITVYKDSIPDVCNDFSESAWNAYDIIDPVSGDVFGSIRDPNAGVTVLAFSPDDSQVLYRTDTPWKDKADCERKPVQAYYVSSIKTGRVMRIDDADAKRKEWDSDFVGAKMAYDRTTKTDSISVGERTIATSTHDIRFIGEYVSR